MHDLLPLRSRRAGRRKRSYRSTARRCSERSPRRRAYAAPSAGPGVQATRSSIRSPANPKDTRFRDAVEVQAMITVAEPIDADTLRIRHEFLTPAGPLPVGGRRRGDARRAAAARLDSFSNRSLFERFPGRTANGRVHPRPSPSGTAGEGDVESAADVARSARRGSRCSVAIGGLLKTARRTGGDTCGGS